MDLLDLSNLDDLLTCSSPIQVIRAILRNWPHPDRALGWSQVRGLTIHKARKALSLVSFCVGNISPLAH